MSMPTSSSHATTQAPAATVTATTSTPIATNGPTSTAATVPHIRIVPHLDAPRSLHFEVVDKDVPEGFVLKIGRFTDKQNLPNRVTFKSKVVSRGHAEIFTEHGKFFIRDTKSSSGTFLNHARLSPPGIESRPTLLKDGDVIQLGVDYQGGTQEIYRCVKMRLELNRSWQQQANPFRENTLKAIRSLTTANASCATDCCICLFRIASFQALFVAPCSHVYHYKCIRPMLVSNHPGFLCPLCRTFADLEDVVEIDDPIEEEMPLQSPVAAIESRHNSVEQINEIEPAAVAQQVEAEPVIAAIEDVSEPTPAPEQAHTFQPPENRPPPLPLDGTGTGSDDAAVLAATETSAPSSPSSSSRPVSTASSSGQQEQSSVSATVCPMNIVNAGSSSTSVDSAVQQSPSAAFLMAPSPPMFVTSFGVSPIPFAAPASPRESSTSSPSSAQELEDQHHHSHSHVPSSPSSHSHMSHMIQNFVRNITIPHRNRSRTNSSSAASPVVATHHQGALVGHTGVAALSQNSGGGASTEVFGKTLVMTPPAPNVLLTSNNRASSGHSGISELGVVSESNMEPGLVGGGVGSSQQSSSQSCDRAHREGSAPLHTSQTVAAEASV
ncbi:hypothetical protein BGZ54_009713 [Gamsiella multidivaricata]|nr:hypothetical protein BGZ54_009713 [Gamsiella multidivaricata]